LNRILSSWAAAGWIDGAGRAGELGATVTLLEKTYRVGAKLLLTGGGRCNLSNSADLAKFIQAFGRNGQFLYRAFSVFFNQDLINFFSARGLEMRTDADGKSFRLMITRKAFCPCCVNILKKATDGYRTIRKLRRLF